MVGLGEAETTPDGKSTCYLHVVSFPSGKEQLKVPVGRSPAEWAAFSPHGRVLAVSIPEESLVVTWDTDTWKRLWQVKLAGPRRIDFTPLGRLMIVETTDNKIHLVDLQDKKVVQVMAGAGPAFSAAGDLLAACNRSKGKLLCWRVSAPRSPRVVTAPSPRRAVGFYAADGVVVAGDKGIYGVDLTTGKSRQVHGGACDDATLSRDGRYVALPQDDAVVVKRLKDGQVATRVPVQASLALVLKSGRIVTSRKTSDGSGALFEVWAGLAKSTK